ncbi:hypothetical protein HDU98_002379 [Podochytrium sp. JEL0797]|nr:hypothetical protein HDU98_002379 [Podochytrium sp. JEL0797]
MNCSDVRAFWGMWTFHPTLVGFADYFSESKIPTFFQAAMVHQPRTLSHSAVVPVSSVPAAGTTQRGRSTADPKATKTTIKSSADKSKKQKKAKK